MSFLDYNYCSLPTRLRLAYDDPYDDPLPRKENEVNTFGTLGNFLYLCTR